MMLTNGAPSALSHVSIKAEFVLDGRGRPIVVGSKHYKIRLWLDGAPSDAHAATYYLHHTYRDPVREAIDGPDFAIELTSYGDYQVKVDVRRRRFSETFRVNLSDALRATYGPCPVNSLVAQAIDRISAA